jgi:hypothetical protein
LFSSEPRKTPGEEVKPLAFRKGHQTESLDPGDDPFLGVLDIVLADDLVAH